MSEAAPTSTRRLLWIAALSCALLAPIVIRVWVDGAAELREADAAAAAGEQADELLHLGRAARFRLPLAAHDELARARLRERAVQATEEARLADALAAWRELRSAILGTRTIGVVDAEQLAAANAAIVELMAREATQAGAPVDTERWAAQLEQDSGSRGRSLLAALCFVGWLAACVGLFVRGLDGKGHIDPRPASRWGAAVLLLLLAWIALM